jgi:hypothetical protein
MEGDARRRFCERCNKDVHDLSTVTRAEAWKLREAHALGGEVACVRVHRRTSDGAIRYADGYDRRSASPSAARGVVTAVLAASLAGCVPASGGGAATPAAIAAEAPAAEPAPASTFVLPPLPESVRRTWPASPAPEAHLKWPMPKAAPTEPPREPPPPPMTWGAPLPDREPKAPSLPPAKQGRPTNGARSTTLTAPHPAAPPPPLPAPSRKEHEREIIEAGADPWGRAD